MTKTTVSLAEHVRLRLEQHAARYGVTLSEAINDLVDDALRRRAGDGFASHAAGDADVDDLGANAEKYLSEGLG